MGHQSRSHGQTCVASSTHFWPARQLTPLSRDTRSRIHLLPLSWPGAAIDRQGVLARELGDAGGVLQDGRASARSSDPRAGSGGSFIDPQPSVGLIDDLA